MPSIIQQGQKLIAIAEENGTRAIGLILLAIVVAENLATSGQQFFSTADLLNVATQFPTRGQDRFHECSRLDDFASARWMMRCTWVGCHCLPERDFMPSVFSRSAIVT